MEGYGGDAVKMDIITPRASQYSMFSILRASSASTPTSPNSPLDVLHPARLFILLLNALLECSGPELDLTSAPGAVHTCHTMRHAIYTMPVRSIPPPPTHR